jgi:hypothetical protein
MCFCRDSRTLTPLAALNVLSFLQGPFVALRKLIVPQIYADERIPEY